MQHGQRRARLALSLTLLTVANAVAEPPRQQTAITISRDTTFLTGPLTADGYVDYPAAMNEHYGRGVTPDNNAAILVWKAVGVPEFLRERPAFWKALDVEPFDTGQYIEDFDVYDRIVASKVPDGNDEILFRRRIADEQRFRETAWLSEDVPWAAEWLEVNTGVLNVLREASHRSRFFVQSAARLSTGSLAPAQVRDGEKLLRARAMLHLGKGDIERAWQDLLTIQRLIVLAGEQPGLSKSWPPEVLSMLNSRAVVGFANEASLDERMARRCFQEWKSHPPVPAGHLHSKLFERCQALQIIAFASKDTGRELGIHTRGRALVAAVRPILGFRVDAAEVLRDFDSSGVVTGLLARLFGRWAVDWDEACRVVNDWHDRALTACHLETYAARVRAFEELDAEYEAADVRSHDPAQLLQLLFDPSEIRQLSARRLAFMLTVLPPADLWRTSRMVHDEMVAMRRMAAGALALSTYRARHQAFPERLADAYRDQDEWLVDPFADRPFSYRRTDEGCMIYSFGRNGQDDGGRSHDDDPPADDIVVRLRLEVD